MTGENKDTDGLPPAQKDPAGPAPSGAGDGTRMTPPVRPPVLRYVPSGDTPASTPAAPRATPVPPASPVASAPQVNAPQVNAPKTPETTESLPPGYYLPPVIGGRAINNAPRPKGPVIIAITLILIVAVVAGGFLLPWRDWFKNSSLPIVGGCAAGTACQAADAYLNAYTGDDFEAMYALTSTASRTRFSDPQILANPYKGGDAKKDAHDYIVGRTQGILAQAEVTSIRASAGDVKQPSATAATVPINIIMSSTRFGEIDQNITLPLINEKGTWKVTWSPGLVFSQLDDQSDPTYRRVVYTNGTVGARGSILDRDGNALAKDDAADQIRVIRAKISNEGALLKTLSDKLGMSQDQVKASYQGGGANDAHLVRTLPAAQYTAISAAISGIAGVDVQQTTARIYPYGEDLAPVTGYVRLDNADCKQAVSKQGVDISQYGAGDYAGCSGLELWGEQYLRPNKGGSLLVVDVNGDGFSVNVGNPKYTLASRVASNGANIRTNISLKDQQAAMAMFRTVQNYSGGAFAVEPSSGAVEVMASYPVCNPNDFSLQFQPGIDTCTNATDGRQINRALTDAQPIGSIFKLVTLSAALEHGVSPTTVYPCTGSLSVPGEQNPRQDNSSSKPDTATAPGAIGPSCDITFWKIAVEDLNAHNTSWLSDEAKGFGYGALTNVAGVSSNVENAGVVPDPQWLQKNKNAGWSPTDAANLGIGQGFFLATPAQVAMASAAIANNGVRMQPRLVTDVTSADGAILASFAAKQVGTLPISAGNLTVLQAAMLGPTTIPSGTAYSEFHDFPLLVAGKTGTAENGQPRPHSWFTSIAPATPPGGSSTTTPSLATSALVEHSTIGEFCAVPVTMQILRANFNLTGSLDPGLIASCQNHKFFP